MRLWFSTALVIAALSGVTLGATSAGDYHQRVIEAAEQLEQIEINAQYGDDAIAAVKRQLPRSEEVELSGQTITVDNDWLHDLLNEYESAGTDEGRRRKLDEAISRLYALAAHLTEVREAQLAQAEDHHARLRAILARPQYQEKSKGPLADLIKRLKREVQEYIRELYNRIMLGLFGQRAESSWVFRTVILVFLGVVLVLALRIALRMNRRRTKPKAKVTVLGEQIEAGTTATDLASEALAAAAAGDFRTGIRRLYIALLYELSEIGLLELEANATNREYLARVSRHQPLAPVMSYLTDRFDYFWYGMFPSSKDDFTSYLARYREAVANARRLAGQPA